MPIERYFAEVSAAPTRAAEVLERAGLIGRGEAHPNLFADYKRRLELSLTVKHHQR